MVGQGRSAQGAIGLTGEELRGHPPAVAGRPEPDQLTDAVEVLGVAVVLAGLAALDGAGVAGRDRVDEDQVRLDEQGLRVLGDGVRRREQGTRVAHEHTPRPHDPRCSHTLEDPGPPLKAKVTGRVVGSAPSSTYAVTDISALAVLPVKTPSSYTSSRRTTRPVVAV